MSGQDPATGPAVGFRAETLGWWVALAAIAVSIWLWMGRNEAARPPEAVPVPSSATVDSGRGSAGEPPARTEAIPLDARRTAELRSELAQARWELESWRRQAEELRTALAAARTDAERHRRGLEQAVTQLNRLAAEVDRLQGEASRAGGRAGSRRSEPRVQALGAPSVIISPMGFVVASGHVRNPRDSAARGTLAVSLVGSAGVIETREFLMSIPPRSTERYDITFTNIFPTERLGATASWRD